MEAKPPGCAEHTSSQHTHLPVTFLLNLRAGHLIPDLDTQPRPPIPSLLVHTPPEYRDSLLCAGRMLQRGIS